MKLCFKSVVICNTLFQDVLLGAGPCVIQIMYHVKKQIADFDACILYPGAMYFMDGFLTGLPQVLNNTSYDFLKSQDGYLIIIKLIKLNKRLGFPLTSKFNEETGGRDVVNEVENEIIYVGKVVLEGLITFHGAEFEYWLLLL